MMKSPQRSSDYHHWLSAWNPILLCLALGCLTSHVESRWCTKMESYQTVRTIIQPSKCNQSYEESCGWFTSKQCTRYEIVDCLKEKNHTVFQYRMITDCCQGFRLDPVNNLTCIVDPAFSSSSRTVKNENSENGHKVFTQRMEKISTKPPSEANDVKEATTVTTGIENVSATHRSVVTVEPKSQSTEDASIKELTHQERDESIFLNLSSGAYTGIICAFVFLLCVLILIGLHFLKNQRRLKAKASQEGFDMDVKQKMISVPARA